MSRAKITNCSRSQGNMVDSLLCVMILKYLKGYSGSSVKNFTKLLAKVTLKFLSWNMTNTPTFFVEKNVSSFCIAKASHIF